MAAIDHDVLLVFLAEAEEHLRTIGRERGPTEERKRAAHSLKGAAAMVQSDPLHRCAKDLEQQIVENGESKILELLAAAKRHLARMARTMDARSSVATTAPLSQWDEETQRLINGVFREEAAEHLDRIESALLELDDSAGRDVALRDIVRTAHTLKGSASTVGQVAISSATHQLEEVVVALERRQRTISHDELRLLSRSVAGLRELIDAELGQTGEPGASVAAASDPLAELSQLCALCDEAADDRAARALKSAPTGECDRAAPAPHPPRATTRQSQGVPVRSPTAEYGAINLVDRRQGQGRRQDDPQFVRIPVALLDALSDSLGPLVIQRSGLERRVQTLELLARTLRESRRAIMEQSGDHGNGAAEAAATLAESIGVALRELDRTTAGIAEESEALLHTTSELSEALAHMRLMPMRWLQARLQRPARQAAATLGKLVTLTFDDESTQLDRAVIEQISDPLIHLVRNAVAHGIERPEVRLAAGKPAVGEIRLSVRLQGELAQVTVSDDGAGIDRDAVRAALVRAGRHSRAVVQQMTDQEVIQSVFSSGLSTQRVANALAGRGVGLDVVQGNLAELGGNVHVTSHPGQGTTFTLEVPVNAAIADALLFKVGSPVYGIPLGYVEETAVLGREELACGLERGSFCHRQELLPLLDLRPLLSVADGAVQTSERSPLVVLRYGTALFAVVCDRVIGPRQVVLKQLGPLLAHHPLFASATVSGSSKVQFVLDIAALYRLAAR